MPGRAGCLLWKVRAKNVCLPSRPSSSQQGYWWEGALGTTIKRRQACFFKLWAPDTRVHSQTFEKWWHGRFLGSLSNFPWIPPQRTTQDSIPQMSLLPSTHHISNLGPPTFTTHNVSHWNLYGVQEKSSSDKEESEEAGASSVFPVFDRAAWTDCLRKIPLGWKKFFLHGQQIWCHQWFIMLSGVQYVYRKFVLLLWLKRRRWREQLVAQCDLVSYFWNKTLPTKLQIITHTRK